MRLTVRGTHRGEVRGFPATGRVEVADGRSRSRSHDEAVEEEAAARRQPREWYESHNHNCSLKDMRLAIALLDTGVYRAEQARNRRICATAARIGSHPPSSTTCRLVRSLIRDAH